VRIEPSERDGEVLVNYVYWLTGVSAAFVVFERIRPRKQQRILRADIATDLFYLVFNGHFLGILVTAVAAPFIARLDAGLEAVELRDRFYLGVAAGLPAWAQFTIAVLTV
jgi:hypothetical protein